MEKETRTRIEEFYGIEQSILLNHAVDEIGYEVCMYLDVSHDMEGHLCPSYRIVVGGRNISDFDNLPQALEYFNTCV